MKKANKKFPYVVLHIAISADGRIDWFTPDIGLYYQLISGWKEDATLAGSDTIQKPGEKIPPEQEPDFMPREVDPKDTRPLMVIPDSKGKVRNWHVLRQFGAWRGMLALCSKKTPKSYLAYLKQRHIEYIIVGNNQVDLKKALKILNQKYQVKVIRVESGGTLNGVLLRAGLVDELSLMLHPNLVGGTSLKTIYRAPDLVSPKGVIKLDLIKIERLKNDVIWIRYKIKK